MGLAGGAGRFSSAWKFGSGDLNGGREKLHSSSRIRGMHVRTEAFAAWALEALWPGGGP